MCQNHTKLLKHTFLICGVILRMATGLTETRRLLLYNRITFILSGAFVGLLKSCIHLFNARNFEHTKVLVKINQLRFVVKCDLLTVTLL